MCLRFRLLHCSLALDVPMDARRMMPYWHYVQSWLILLINFIQFLELIFVNKFTFSSTTWKKISISYLLYFYSNFFTSITIKLYNHLITNVSGENNYFYYIIIINCIKNNEIFLSLNRLFVLAVAQTSSVKKFLVISQNSQENTCARVTFWISLLKKRIWHRCFPVNFVKFLRKPEQLWTTACHRNKEIFTRLLRDFQKVQ